MKTKSILITIIILIVLVMLAGEIAPYFIDSTAKPRWDSALPKIAYIESVINSYKKNTGKLPDKLEDLLYCPNGLEKIWQGPYLVKESQLYDPWGNPYVYTINLNDPNSFGLISYGKDGKPGGKGYKADIYND